MPLIIGGIEASLRRIVHFDDWQEKVRRSILAGALKIFAAIVERPPLRSPARKLTAPSGG